MNTIICVVVALFILALLVFPDFRKKLKVLVGGFLNVFVEDQAKTPEGAAAIFNQAIAEKQIRYNQAAATLNKLSGELNHAKQNVERLKAAVKNAEDQCERLVRSGKMQEAKVFAERRSELLAELEAENQKVAKLTPMVAKATEIHSTYSRDLRALERKKKETVSKIKMNSQMKEMYNDLDELCRDSATDKMMDAVLEGSSELEKEADGARIVHENRASTKIARAEQKAAQTQSEEYLASIAQKYNGGSK